MNPAQGDFASIMADANKMTSSAISHPYGTPSAGLARGARGANMPVRQTTQMFFLPKMVTEYDECCNRIWAGEITSRFEERNFTKDGEMIIVLSYFENAAPPRAGEVPANDGVEPEEKSRKLP